MLLVNRRILVFCFVFGFCDFVGGYFCGVYFNLVFCFGGVIGYFFGGVVVEFIGG